jgi:programmed cell death protein 10
MEANSKGVVASLALHTVLEPIFTEMEREESLLASVQTLRDAFTKVERSHPGVSEEFLSGLLEAEGVAVNLPEALLQLACQDGDHYTIPSDEREYALLNQRARALKVKLSHIPDQIQNRSQFLNIIRDIASAIKDVLDAVNEVSKKHHGDPRMREYKKVSALK